MEEDDSGGEQLDFLDDLERYTTPGSAEEDASPETPPTGLTVDELWEDFNLRWAKNMEEDGRFERKSGRIQPDDLAECFVSFANANPEGGIVVVGIEDNGKFTGFSDQPTKRINKIEKARINRCPDVMLYKERIHEKNSDGEEDFIIAFRIHYRDDKLVETTGGKALRRVGDSDVVMSDEEKREARIDRGQVNFETEVEDSYRWPEDFNTDIVENLVENVKEKKDIEYSRRSEEVLQLLRLGEIDSGSFIPYNSLVILCSKDTDLKFPGCYVRFLKFDGVEEYTGDRRNVVKDIPIEGNVIEIIEGMHDVLKSQLREFSRLNSDGIFEPIPEYPEEAWYEAIVNACVHRSYSMRKQNIFARMFDNRLEIVSPGGFPPNVTPENIYDIHSPRNPRLMRAMYHLGLVREAREGARRMKASMEQQGLPEPDFSQEETSANSRVKVVLQNNIDQRRVWVDREATHVVGEAIAETLSDEERRLINAIAEQGSMQVSPATRILDCSWHTAKGILEDLVERDILVHKSKSFGHPDNKYVLRNGDN